jgi:hypothetical protein
VPAPGGTELTASEPCMTRGPGPGTDDQPQQGGPSLLATREHGGKRPLQRPCSTVRYPRNIPRRKPDGSQAA